MKSTMIMRSVANPRRTTLAHLRDGGDLGSATRGQVVEWRRAQELPTRTANPRRTVIVDDGEGGTRTPALATSQSST